jgi:hypothetical protein
MLSSSCTIQHVQDNTLVFIDMVELQGEVKASHQHYNFLIYVNSHVPRPLSLSPPYVATMNPSEPPRIPTHGTLPHQTHASPHPSKTLTLPPPQSHPAYLTRLTNTLLC